MAKAKVTLTDGSKAFYEVSNDTNEYTIRGDAESKLRNFGDYRGVKSVKVERVDGNFNKLDGTKSRLIIHKSK